MWEGSDAHTEARAFCELWGVGGTVLLDEHGELAQRLGIRGVPANVFVDSDGTVTAVGAATPEELEAATRALLGPDVPIDPSTPAPKLPTDPGRIERNVTARGGGTGDQTASGGASSTSPGDPPVDQTP